jgi:hypothetical protein
VGTAVSVTPPVEWIVSAEHRTALEPLLARALHYAPPWLANVSVIYDPHEKSLLSTTVLPEYRVQTIRVGNGWFSETAEERAVNVYHEALHAHVETLAVVFQDLLTACEPSDQLRRWAEEQWRRAEEAVVSDLARSIAGREELIPEAPSNPDGEVATMGP